MVAGAISAPKHRQPGENRRGDDDASDDDDPSPKGNIRSTAKNETAVDSDFEFDL
jgi:hypothetical protein